MKNYIILKDSLLSPSFLGYFCLLEIINDNEYPIYIKQEFYTKNDLIVRDRIYFDIYRPLVGQCTCKKHLSNYSIYFKNYECSYCNTIILRNDLLFFGTCFAIDKNSTWNSDESITNNITKQISWYIKSNFYYLNRKIYNKIERNPVFFPIKNLTENQLFKVFGKVYNKYFILQGK